MPGPDYEVVLVHKDLDDFAEAVRNEISAATEEVLLQREVVTFSVDLNDDHADTHTIVVYLASEEGATDEQIRALLNRAVSADLPILPLMRSREPGTTSEKLPEVLKFVNAADWDDNKALCISVILILLGLAEPERKVFLSYRRTDGAVLAVQLHTALAQLRFDVFLDRFTVPPGADFQVRIDRDLSDKAFVLLVESPGLRESPWVEHEIAYAHSHRIGVFALTLPSTADTEIVPSVDEAFRFRLDPNDLESTGRLTADALSRVLARIELRHARELRRRREQLNGSLRDKLFMDGCTSAPAGEWALVATGPDRRPAVFLITPRSPGPGDLYALHLVRLSASSAADADLDAAVVHESEHLDEKQLALLEWIGEPRQFESVLLHGCALKKVDAS